MWTLRLYLPPERPSQCVSLLQDIGCTVVLAAAAESLREHGFLQGGLSGGTRLDIFLPIVPFYEAARSRRKRLELAGQPIMVWDAESLVVFRMTFFRRKDLADVEKVLRTQGPQLDRLWVRTTRRYVRWGRPPALGVGRPPTRSANRECVILPRWKVHSPNKDSRPPCLSLCCINPQWRDRSPVHESCTATVLRLGGMVALAFGLVAYVYLAAYAR